MSPEDRPPQLADQFEARLTWRGREPLLAERSYLIRHLGTEAELRVTAIKHRLDPALGARLAAKTLAAGETAIVNLWTSLPIAFDPSEPPGSEHRCFAVGEPISAETIADGEIMFALRRATNVHWQPAAVDKATRARLKLQQPCCIWLTGLPSSGKSTIANRLEMRLLAQGMHSYLLDGDNVRHGLNRDLGFTAADRVENVRRVIEVARLMVDAGLIVITALISPFRAERRQARAGFSNGEFIEVFVDAPLAVCEARDPKGLYAKARLGELPNFTGVDSPYEAPDAPELHLRTAEEPIDDCVDRIFAALERMSEISR